ncbi:MAG TPA: signal peptidase I [Ktedonobacterales bacterium]|nr:signal peptidase I [Ktedonobacterales bacterium]
MARSSVISENSDYPGKQSAQEEDYDYQDEQGEQWAGRLLVESLEVCILTLLIFLGIRLAVQNYIVDGPSMRPTLQTNEFILVDKSAYFFSSPQRGDVIVFHFPLDPRKDYVKRVIGIPGDTVTVTAAGIVTVDGVTLKEPYVNDLTNPFRPETITLGPNQYFVLGDNRGDSSDSRDWGPVPRKDIVGRADLVYWPLVDAHLLKNWSGVFHNIHR